ncbi:MAG: hypothetical protein ACOVJ6_08365, partial [Pirellulales bacterium]
KLQAWLDAGCREAWAIDPSSRTVSIHRPAAPISILRESDTLSSTVLTGLTISLVEIFRSIEQR